MSKSETASQKKRSRLFEYVGVLAVIGILVGAAFFQEQISAFFRLRLWDREAPAKVVEGFLSAGKKGDKEGSKKFLGSNEFQELNQDGKWKGYFITTQAGTMDYDFSLLCPSGEPKAEIHEIIEIGKGAAVVKAADSTGKEVRYRLEMKEGGWKITEILGGKGRTPAPPPSKSKSKSDAKAPGK